MPRYVDRFGTALSVLAGHGHIKKRLLRAYEENLTYIDDDTLPESIEVAFTELRRRMTAVAPLNGEGAIFASVRKMSIPEADECAQLILGIYVELVRDGASLATVAKEKKGESAAVPAMLLKTV